MKYSILILALSFIISGCATDTPRGRVTNAVLEEVFNSVVSFGLSEGASALAGQNGQDAAQAAFVAAQTGILSARGIQHIVGSYAGTQVANKAAQQFAVAAPTTPGDAALVSNTIGAALQIAANQLAAK